MNKMTGILTLALACAWSGAFAQAKPVSPGSNPPVAKDSKMQGKPVATKPAAAPKATKVTGPVKGAPTGTTFVIASKKGTTTVEAGKATFMMKGKPFEIKDLKAGSFVSATGSMNGKTLVAEKVDVFKVPGAAKPKGGDKMTPAPKPAGDKMTPAPKKP